MDPERIPKWLHALSTPFLKYSASRLGLMNDNGVAIYLPPPAAAYPQPWPQCCRGGTAAAMAAAAAASGGRAAEPPDGMA